MQGVIPTITGQDRSRNLVAVDNLLVLLVLLVPSSGALSNSVWGCGAPARAWGMYIGQVPFRTPLPNALGNYPTSRRPTRV